MKQTAEEKSKLSSKMTLGYVFNFVPIALSNRKAIKTTPNILQRLIKLQKAIYVEFLKEEKSDEIKTYVLDALFLCNQDGNHYSCCEFLMELTQKTNEDKLPRQKKQATSLASNKHHISGEPVCDTKIPKTHMKYIAL